MISRIILLITLILFSNISYAEVPPTTHKISFNNLQRGEWSTTAKVRRKGYIETDIKLNTKYQLVVENRFVNRRRSKGFTGCAHVKVIGYHNQVLASRIWQRGVNAKGYGGRKIKVESGLIDIRDAISIGIKNVTVKHYRCSRERVVSGFVQGVKDITKAFRRGPGGVVSDAPVKVSGEGYSDIRVTNCSPKNRRMSLYFRNTRASDSSFKKYGAINNHWRGSTCSSTNYQSIDVTKNVVYELVFVLTGANCPQENPNILSCQRYKTFIRGNGKSGKAYSMRID